MATWLVLGVSGVAILAAAMALGTGVAIARFTWDRKRGQ